MKQQKTNLKELLQQAKQLVSSPTASPTAKRKQELREFQRAVRRALSRPNSTPISNLDDQLQEIVNHLSISDKAAKQPEPQTEIPLLPSDMPLLETPSLQAEVATLNSEQIETLRNALTASKENPVDPSKPYATPWRPRDFMSAFAFIPRYLEVHPKICAAVYLRHPVARPGLAEVPTPFTGESMALAHNWYLRHR